MLEQYFGMKAKHPDAILLSRVGDFYEAYGDDADTIARALSIALTSKDAGSGRKIAMAGVPYHALDGYLAKLVAQRRVVAHDSPEPASGVASSHSPSSLKRRFPTSSCGATSFA